MKTVDTKEHLILKYIVMTTSDPRVQNNFSSVHKILKVTPFLQVSAAGRFSGARWLVFSDAVSPFVSLNVPFDCELLVAQWDGAVARLSEVYRVSPEQSLKVLHFGDWSPDSHKNWPSGGLYRRRTSLEGRVIKTAILDDVRLYSQTRMPVEHLFFVLVIVCDMSVVCWLFP
jgi:hypothetical protein